MTYDDARLAALYDQDNPDGPDHDFFRALADRLGAVRILDLGCGTGVLTVSLARAGRHVIGIDPSTAMLDVARQREGGGDVQWIVGDSASIPGRDWDLALMTGNVAQHLDDEQWSDALAALHGALRTGGALAFETRDPEARAWTAWASGPAVRSTRFGALEEWTEVEQVGPGRIRAVFHNQFLDDGWSVDQVEVLTFRGEGVLRGALSGAGFTTIDVRGGWGGEPVGSTGLLVVTATR